ncbi:MAG TPA: thioredoxin domain-containing protein [Candidatus Deferrimicrobiaceae bacterium]|jgi:protein-disulfide isomerase|nr:thioredoxin domain-containing protein [Candidatus Deferrimicrobiaceae bacterium]
MARLRVYTLRVAAGLLAAAWAAAATAQEAPRFTVDPAMTRGPAGAKVTIFEWSDYECPYCKRAQEVLDRLQGEFPDTVRLVVKDFPLRSHPNAVPAANAARCAGAQGRYWEYHDLLFVAQPAFSRDDLIGYARRLGLDVGPFTECLDGGRFRDAVLADQREGSAAGVRATPTFFINQRKIEGALPLDEFRAAIEQALRDAGR